MRKPFLFLRLIAKALKKLMLEHQCDYLGKSFKQHLPEGLLMAQEQEDSFVC